MEQQCNKHFRHVRYCTVSFFHASLYPPILAGARATCRAAAHLGGVPLPGHTLRQHPAGEKRQEQQYHVQEQEPNSVEHELGGKDCPRLEGSTKGNAQNAHQLRRAQDTHRTYLK